MDYKVVTYYEDEVNNEQYFKDLGDAFLYINKIIKIFNSPMIWDTMEVKGKRVIFTSKVPSFVLKVIKIPKGDLEYSKVMFELDKIKKGSD